MESPYLVWGGFFALVAVMLSLDRSIQPVRFIDDPGILISGNKNRKGRGIVQMLRPISKGQPGDLDGAVEIDAFQIDLENEANLLPVVRRYLAASIVTNKALIRLYEKEQFVHTLSNQAIYVPQGNVVSISQKFNSHLVAWDLSYRQSCVIFCHDNTHIYSLLDESNRSWESLPWNGKMEARITEYLQGRWTSKFDWLKVLTEKVEIAECREILTDRSSKQ